MLEQIDVVNAAFPQIRVIPVINRGISLSGPFRMFRSRFYTEVGFGSIVLSFLPAQHSQHGGDFAIDTDFGNCDVCVDLFRWLQNVILGGLSVNSSVVASGTTRSRASRWWRRR